ncbi:MAG: MBL fold metallo-hydrolase, partial [Nocardiaceae bacterium]|nr:MBL fold metallo-hydrolase [Nocardiaceae bacterium]
MALGDHIQIGPLTRLIVGQELNMAAGQPDVCNVILHRTGDVLVIVDTGATSVIRDAIRSIAEDLQPWSKVLLLTTHAHI